jgi:hypothetical protein
MTAPVPAVPPPPEDLTARVFRALYPEFDLHALAGTYLALPLAPPATPPRPSARSPARSAAASATSRTRRTRRSAPACPAATEPGR